jgi:hypothetical protein
LHAHLETQWPLRWKYLALEHVEPLPLHRVSHSFHPQIGGAPDKQTVKVATLERLQAFSSIGHHKRDGCLLYTRFKLFDVKDRAVLVLSPYVGDVVRCRLRVETHASLITKLNPSHSNSGNSRSTSPEQRRIRLVDVPATGKPVE